MITQMIRKHIFLCNRCVCNQKTSSQTINVCNWHVHRKYLMEAAELQKNNSCQNTLCNRCPVQLGD